MDYIEVFQDILCLTLFGTEILEMADDLSHLLFSFANYSNFYAVVTILFCFITTAILILRFNNDLIHFPNLAPIPTNDAKKKPMVGCTNPFCVQLKTSSTTLKDGFTLLISSLTSGNLHVFWGVSMNKIHEEMQGPTDKLIDSLTSGQPLLDTDSLSTQDFRLKSDSKQELHFKCPDSVTEAALGSSPRQRYPCVVVTSISSEDIQDHETTVAVGFWVIHLQDSIVSMKSQIVGQYLKMFDGRVFNLQPVFLATDNSCAVSSNMHTKDPEDTDSRKALFQKSDSDGTNTTSFTADDSVQRDSAKANDCKTRNLVSQKNCDIETDLVSATEEHVTFSHPDEAAISNVHTDRISECNPLNHVRRERKLCDKSETSSQSSKLKSDMKLCGSDLDEVDSVRSSQPAKHNLVVSEENDVRTGSNLSVSTHSPAEADSNELDTESNSDKPECVVCQVNSISIVILPCRHACTCRSCFTKIDRCPMCRAHMETYFSLVDEETADVDVINESPPPAVGGFMAWFTNLNDNLNEFLGFT